MTSVELRAKITRLIGERDQARRDCQTVAGILARLVLDPVVDDDGWVQVTPHRALHLTDDEQAALTRYVGEQ